MSADDGSRSEVGKLMSHQILNENSEHIIYSRELAPGVFTIWYENGTGISRGCLILTARGGGVAEMQIPLQNLPMNKFLVWKQETENFCRNHGWDLVYGYTVKALGDFLILSDPRVFWTDEEISVGPNYKRKLVWDLNKSL